MFSKLATTRIIGILLLIFSSILHLMKLKSILFLFFGLELFTVNTTIMVIGGLIISFTILISSIFIDYIDNNYTIEKINF